MPTYETIGIAAPVVLVLLRLVQGFSVGGEFSGTLVLLNESARSGRRGFTAALAQTTSGLGVLAASLVATLTHALLSTSQTQEWGWRVAFAVGAAIGVLAVVMRLRMGESPAFEAARQAGRVVANPAKEAIRHHRSGVWRVFALTAYLGIAYYMVATWLPSYLDTVIGAKPDTALFATTCGAILYALACPLVGALSDRIGRKPILLSGAAGFAILSYPLFLLVGDTSFLRILVGTLALMSLVVWFTGAFTVTVTELFPTSVRFSGLALGYNVGNAIFAGTAPLVATALVKITGWDESPSLYLIVPSLLMLALIARMPEPKALGDAEEAAREEEPGAALAAAGP